MLAIFAKYHVTTFCAPPTIYRFLHQGGSFQVRSVRSDSMLTIAGEPLNPEVYHQFQPGDRPAQLMEGFGQTETTRHHRQLHLVSTPSPAPWASPRPLYDVDLVDDDGNSVRGTARWAKSSCAHAMKARPCGMFTGYYQRRRADARGLARRCLSHGRHRLAR